MSPGPHGAGTPGLSEDRCPAVPKGSCAGVLTAGVTGNKEGTKSRGRRGALGSPLPGDREGEGSSVLQQERQGLRRWGCLPTEPFLTVAFL